MAAGMPSAAASSEVDAAAEVSAERAARAARLVTSGSSGSGSPGIADAFESGPAAQTAVEHCGRPQARMSRRQGVRERAS